MADEPTPQGPGKDWHTLHLWQIQPIRDVLLGLAIFGVLYLGYLISIVTVPIMLAALLAYLFEPLIQKLVSTKRFSRQGSVILVLIASALIIVVPVTLGLGFAIVQGVGAAGRIAQNTSTLVTSIENPDDQSAFEALPEGGWRSVRDYIVAEREKIQEAEGPTDGESVDTGDVERSSVVSFFDVVSGWVQDNSDAIGRQAVQTGRGAISAALSMLASIGTLGFTLFLTAFFFFFIATGFGHFKGFWVDLLPERNKERTLHLIKQFDSVIAGFVRGRITIALIQSVIFTVAYWAIGVPVPLLLGPLVAVLSIVPYLALVGIPVAILLMWLEPSGVAWQATWWWILAAPTAVYFIIQALDDYVWTPIIQGKSTNMDTPSILFASIAGGALAGVYGLLLGIPVAACGKIVIKEIVWPRFEEWKSGRAKDPLPLKSAEE
ncbi:MAG: AI-2E family transporter [Phycisphaerales bacterium JB043]